MMKTKMNKPIQGTCSSMPDFEEYIEEIKDLWQSHWLTNMSVKHKQLETELSQYLNSLNITLFTNSHLILECVIAVFHLTGEVITTPFTFPATVQALDWDGLTPVFCDIEKDTLNIDLDKIDPLLQKKQMLFWKFMYL